jgi:hypothetical protein
MYHLKEKDNTRKMEWQGNVTLGELLFRQGEDFTIDIAWTLYNPPGRLFPVSITSAGHTELFKYKMPICVASDSCINQAPNFLQVGQIASAITFNEYSNLICISY